MNIDSAFAVTKMFSAIETFVAKFSSIVASGVEPNLPRRREKEWLELFQRASLRGLMN